MTAYRVRLLTLVAGLAAAAVLAPAGGAGVRDSGAPALPTIYVVYTMSCTFSIVDDQGKPVTSIAPGSYQVEVSTPIMFKLAVPGGPSVDQIAPNDFTGCKGWVQFQLTGPGVSLSTTLDSGCDAFLILPAQTFRANSTYTAVDNNQPSVARASFTTLASGTPVTATSPYGATSGKGTSQQDLVGSLARGSGPVLGTLTGTLSGSGKPTLTAKGKPVSVLSAGRYKFSITDRDAKASFTLQAVNGGAKALTAPAFVGKHSVTVTLRAGRWMYYSNPGKALYFLVTS